MRFTTKQLAEMIDASIDGDENVIITDFAKIEEAKEGSLTFLANPKYTHYIYTTKASAVLVSNDFQAEEPVRATLLRVADPYSTLARLMTEIQKHMPHPSGVEQPCFIAEGVEVPDDAYIGAFAYIGRGARLGQGVRIYPQAYVGEGVEIGADTVIYPGVRIYRGCRIGSRCILQAGCVIGADGFGFAPTADGYQKIPQTGIVEIEDDVEIGANATVDRATMGVTRIGRGTKLDNLVQVAHNVEIGRHNVFAAQGGVAGSTHIGDWNRFGGQVGLAGHITVGDMNEFGAQSGVPKSVGSNQRLMGYPVTDAMTFARNAVYINRLRELFDHLNKTNKKNNQ